MFIKTVFFNLLIAYILFDFVSNTSDIENLKTFDDITISENETIIYSLDEYFTNSNLKFSINITDQSTNLFTLSLSESFNNLLQKEIEQNSNLKRIKNIESINSYVVLFENTIMIINWDQTSSVISTTCSKYDIPDMWYMGNKYDHAKDCSATSSKEVNQCHDFEEIFINNNEYFSSTFIVIDCDDKESQNQIFYYLRIEVSERTNPGIFLFNYQYFEKEADLNNTRRLLYNNNTQNLYRYSPFSLKTQVENISKIQVFSQNLFEFSLINIIPNTTQYTENIHIINGLLAILDYNANLSLFNLANQNYSDQNKFNLSTYEYSIQMSYYFSRLFVLSNSTIYRFSITSDQNISSFVYSLNFPDGDSPLAITQTQEYLYVLFRKYLKIFRIDDTSSKKMNDSSFQYDFIQNVNEERVLLKFPDQYLKNSFTIWCLKKSVEIGNIWTLNITQIQKKLLTVTCCNKTQYPSFDPSKSMQNFSFNLTINEKHSSKINIYYWNIHDVHLYFDPTIRSSYNESLTYFFDSENILIPYTNWVTGPLKKVDIESIHPYSTSFKVDCYKKFDVSFDYLKKNNDIDVNYNSITNSEFLNLTLNSTHLTIYWQTSKDLTFYIIDCFVDNDYMIEDCVMSFRNDQTYKTFEGAFRYKNFHIINTQEGLLYLKTGDDGNTENQEMLDLYYDEKKSIACNYMYLYEEKDLIFCQTINNEIIINKLKKDDNYNSLNIDSQYIYDFPDDNPHNLNQIYIDFIELYNCLVVKADQKLIFYEILFPISDDNFVFLINKKYSYNLEAFTDIYLINKEIPLIIIIDIQNDIIKEFTLRIPINLIFLRKYPNFNYNFVSSFKCNDRFLCLNVMDKNSMNNYIVIYNVTEPTSKLLRNKILIDPNNDKIYPIIINEKDSTHGFFQHLFKTSSIFMTLNPKTGVSINFYKVCDILANIPEVFHDPNIVNHPFYQYDLVISFTNEMMKEMIFFQIIVNISLSNSIISINKYYNTSVINFVDPPESGSKYILKMVDFPFFGPIKNYKIYNDYFLSNNEMYYYDIYPYVEKILDFEEDYNKVLNFYGVFTKALYKEGILIVLSEKKLTFHNVYSEDYEILYNDNPGNNETICTDILLHSSLNLLFVICNYKDSLILKSYEYNTINVNGSKKIEINKSNVTNFKVSFENYISAVMSDYHIFFLVEEGYYLELHKKRKSIYIFGIPTEINKTYVCGPAASISDKDFKNSSFFVMSDAVDLQTYYVKNFSENSSFYTILILTNTDLHIIKVNLTTISAEAFIITHFTINNLLTTQTSFNNNYVFYTVTLLNLSILDDFYQNSNNNNETNFINFTLIYILSSNLDIYEFNTTIINDVNITTTTTHIYTKYYSCIFTDTVRPRKFKYFLGSFCMKTDLIDGINENGINYFVLHKIHDENQQFLSPVFALPIYLKNYNFQFIFNDTNDYLILPSFSSLFTEFQLKDSLYLFLRKNPNALMTKITAYNEISNASIILNIIISNKEESFKPLYIILICLFSVLFSIFIGIVSYFCYRKIKANQRETLLSQTDSEIDVPIKPRISDIGYNNENTEKSKKTTNCKNSTSFNSRMRTTSFIRVKLKNDKWIES